jgi:hypothetical protein
MKNDTRSELARQAIQYVQTFIDNLVQEGQTYLPKCLKTYGRWMANYTGYVLGIYFLSKEELKRVVEHQNKGLPPFPGFLISEELKPPNDDTAILTDGTCNYYASNRTVNMWAFTVKPGASFTVVDHFHEIKDSSSGHEFKFRVDLAFILGLQKKERWADIEPRLAELLSHTVVVWKKLQ